MHALDVAVADIGDLETTDRRPDVQPETGAVALGGARPLLRHMLSLEPPSEIVDRRRIALILAFAQWVLAIIDAPLQGPRLFPRLINRPIGIGTNRQDTIAAIGVAVSEYKLRAPLLVMRAPYPATPASPSHRMRFPFPAAGGGVSAATSASVSLPCTCQGSSIFRLVIVSRARTMPADNRCNGLHRIARTFTGSHWE